MKRTEIRRNTPLKSGKAPKRSAMKRSQIKRDWTAARAKVDEEGKCRACGKTSNLEAAHILGREHDTTPTIFGDVELPLVAPTRIVPLCGPAIDPQTCHGKDHAHQLDLLPLLTLDEQLQAVADAGGIAAARKQTLSFGRFNL